MVCNRADCIRTRRILREKAECKQSNWLHEGRSFVSHTTFKNRRSPAQYPSAMCLCRQLLDFLVQPFRVLAPTLSAGELPLRKIESPDRGSTIGLDCSRGSDCRAREKNSRREKKRGETRRRKGERTLAPLPHPPGIPVYNLTRSPLTATLYYLNAWNRLQ